MHLFPELETVEVKDYTNYPWQVLTYYTRQISGTDPGPRTVYEGVSNEITRDLIVKSF